MTEPANPWRRRALLASGALAIAAWGVGAPRMADLWPAQLIYRDMPGLTPFRELEMAWGQSSAAVVLSCVVVRTPGNSTQDVRIASVRADPCTSLFGPDIEPRLPIVFFSDFNCPNCCVLDAILADHDATNPGTIRII